MRTRVVVAALAAAWLTAPIAAQAQTLSPDGRLRVEQWLDWERVGSPRLSPDGERILYTRGYIDKMHDSWESTVWIMNVDGTRNRQLVDGSSPRWSPDGTRIAYVAEDENGDAQIFVRWMDAEGAVTRVTNLTDGPSDIAWSPDGERIAFTMRVPPDRPTEGDWSIDLPRPEGAEWTPNPRIIERVVYRRDGAGFVDESFRHVFVVPATGGTPRRLTTGDRDHGDPVWTADGSGILFDGLLEEDAAYHWKESEIYRVDVATGEITQLTSRRGPDGDPVPSPDGRWIAYVGHDTTGLDYIEADLYVMEADGSSPRRLTEGLDRSPDEVFWAPDGDAVYFNLEADGYANLYRASLDGDWEPVTEGAHVLEVEAIGPDGLAVGTRTAPRVPEDIVVFDLERPDEIRRLTRVNDDVLAGIELGRVEEVWYESEGKGDGRPGEPSRTFRVQGWIVKPPDFDPSREYPLILSIHGGPHAMYDGGFSFRWQEHAANGYVVLYTNPRGSAGYGTEFGNAIQYAYPGDDFHDLMAGVDTVVGRGYIDEDNMFVYGCSGGGVLTAWVVGHTDRFRAAASLCPVIDWISFVGNVDGNYLRWYADFEHFPWDDPSEHLRRSPLSYIGNVTTPTLLMTGVKDMRTPISQTEEFYQALKAQGKPAAMIRMVDEWHGTSRNPSNFIRTQLYLRKWFERWGDHEAERVTTDSP